MPEPTKPMSIEEAIELGNDYLGMHGLEFANKHKPPFRSDEYAVRNIRDTLLAAKSTLDAAKAITHLVHPSSSSWGDLYTTNTEDEIGQWYCGDRGPKVSLDALGRLVNELGEAITRAESAVASEDTRYKTIADYKEFTWYCRYCKIEGPKFSSREQMLVDLGAHVDSCENGPNKTIAELRTQLATAESTIANVAKTADGMPIIYGMKVWEVKNGVVTSHIVKLPHDELYSTEAAARAAATPPAYVPKPTPDISEGIKKLDEEIRYYERPEIYADLTEHGKGTLSALKCARDYFRPR